MSKIIQNNYIHMHDYFLNFIMTFHLQTFDTATKSWRKRAEIYFLYDFGVEKGHDISEICRKQTTFFTEPEQK